VTLCGEEWTIIDDKEVVVNDEFEHRHTDKGEDDSVTLGLDKDGVWSLSRNAGV